MSDISAEQLAEALRNCANEPVHIPGTIQPHGYLLVFSKDLKTILAISEGVQRLFNLAATDIFRCAPPDLLPAALFEAMNNAVKRLKAGVPNWSFDCSLAKTELNECFCTCYLSDSVLVVEIEPVLHRPADDYVAEITYQLERIRETSSIQQTLEQLTKSVAVLTGYERVLVYRFDNDWNGQVIAEHRDTDDIHSYLDHNFPASDIPAQVRALYQKNVMREITDATAEPEKIIANPDKPQAPDIDLTAGVLRGVSPIHLKYLANMEVKRALSVAIFEDSKLWGLLSCHGLNQSQVHPYQRQAVKALVAVANERMLLQRQYAAERFYAATEKSRKALLDPKKEIMAPDELLSAEGHAWLKLFHVETVALVHGRQTTIIGGKCDRKVLTEATQWLVEKHSTTGLFSTSEIASTELRSAFAETGFCGLLGVALPYDRSKDAWLLFLRKEILEVKNWAGHPEKKQVERYKGKDVLSPRESFASWQEIINGKSSEWLREQKQAARFLAEDLAIGASAYQIEQLNEKLKKANKRLQHLVHTDALTQIWNRYHMEQSIDEQISAAKRYNRDLAVIIFDIDDFKGVNDTYGHDVGDSVLKNLARGLEDVVREGDIFGRWGGEEFLVVAIESDLKNATRLAERLREKLLSIEFPKVEKITASFGVAELRESDSRTSLVKRADEALYEAKNSGRDRVISNT
ncbi:diguanylate cyclase [Pseudidiomarina sp.]|uniref:sensor domain-containing diguanylate cyclase n=1 Tax=Pseudidiomarina sp. TaxID=2081707 RepID=UPI00299DA3C2|nr:diguanylate cyclase [Pseudidiomarina sp.]MDX1705464.1 diguanylate cyclase [Pseudidiomarina sp.]